MCFVLFHSTMEERLVRMVESKLINQSINQSINITTSLEAGEQLDAVVLDFSKAFDKVPHKRLCMKLEHYGIRGSALLYFGWRISLVTGLNKYTIACGFYGYPNEQNRMCELCTFFQIWSHIIIDITSALYIYGFALYLVIIINNNGKTAKSEAIDTD